MGALSGKLGNFVAVDYEGKNILRARPTLSKRTPTPQQLKARERFTVVTQFLSQVRKFIEQYFLPFSGAKKAFGKAMAYHLRYAVVEEEKRYKMHLLQVVFAHGPLLTEPIKIIVSDKLCLHWADISDGGMAKAEDQLTLLWYDEQQKQLALFPAIAQRCQKEIALAFPKMQSSSIHLWSVWIRAKEKKHSASYYIGNIVLDGY